MTQKDMKFHAGEAWIPGLALIFALTFLSQTTDASFTVMRWPYMILAISAILWLGIVGRYVFSRTEDSRKPSFNLGRLTKPALMVTAPIIYLSLMPFLGFAPSTFIFLLALFRLLGGKSWKTNVIIALSMTLALQLALVNLMHMNLPRLVIGSLVL